MPGVDDHQAPTIVLPTHVPQLPVVGLTIDSALEPIRGVLDGMHHRDEDHSAQLMLNDGIRNVQKYVAELVARYHERDKALVENVHAMLNEMLAETTSTFTISGPRTLDGMLETARQLFQEWDTDHGSAEFEQEGHAFRLTLVTGGWSENEYLLPPSSNMFHITCWESSTRGGLHVYSMGTLTK